ncbi:MAG: prolyl oligopeptidase family serine peptidase [Clostridia bacterium]|nr:prolyl oligopeptidase family serine peptidase [Clostridia bacterium]
MALFKMYFFSEALGMQSSVLAVIPQKSAAGQIGIENKSDGGQYKVLYLLHGLSDDETIWLRRTSIERYAARYGIAVIMPNGHRSFYCDMKYGGNYYDYITRELPFRVHEFFHLSDKREDTYIAGLSMGGYGALKAALREPDKYAMAAGLSAVTDMRGFTEQRSGALASIFGNEDVPPEDDLFYLARKGMDRDVKPKLYIGCGRQDMLYSENQDFVAELKKDGYDVTYRESDGNHTWEFWDEYILYVLEWMLGGK